MNSRAGRFVRQPAGFEAFIPKPLPHKPGITMNNELQSLLSQADRAVAKLDGIITVLPSPELFIAMYVKKEALLSSQIEGTQASLEGVLEYEAELKPKESDPEIKDVINYINALYTGIDRLQEIPMSIRLIKEIHKILLTGARGEQRNPGEFRKSQNWIGTPGGAIEYADYIPPPQNMVLKAMGDLEIFLHSTNDNIPVLIKTALIHAQFETIHPFLDGNGRIGRLLITFYLFWRGELSKPLLYLSFYLKKHKPLYYDLLMKVRTGGAWEDWVIFFLNGIKETSEEASRTARDVIVLKEEYKGKLFENSSVNTINVMRLLDMIFEEPIFTINSISKNLKISKVSSINLAKRFEEIGLIQSDQKRKWRKEYINRDYIEIIARGTRD